jgi:Tfp pilus assembly protein FimT
MLRNHKGVTLFEIVTVTTLAAIMMVVALPKVAESRRAAAMASARLQVESYLAAARETAKRNGGKTQLVHSANTLTIQADTGTGWVTIGRPIQLDASSNIALTSALASTTAATTGTIAFDGRGIASGLNAGGAKFYFTIASGYGAGMQDSLCLTRFGAVLDKKCGQAAAPPPSEILIEPDISLPPSPSPDVVSPY